MKPAPRTARLLVPWLLLAAPVAARGASIHAEVDARKLGVDDQVRLTITLEGGSDVVNRDVPVPSLENLRVVGGPFVSTQLSIVNGSISQSRSLTYALQPQRVGKARIGPVKVTLPGGPQATEPIDLEVVAGSIRPAAPGQQPFDPFSNQPFPDPFGMLRERRSGPLRPLKLFLEAHASRSRLYVGEPLLLTYFLYTQTAVTDVRPLDAPQYPGFWSEDLDDKSGAGPQGSMVTVKGERYQRFPILKRVLFPTRAGSLTIPASRFRVGLGPQGFFDTGPGAVDRSTAPVQVTARALPTAPGFSGAVGRFEVAAAVDRRAVHLGDAVTLRLVVNGKGNLRWVDAAPALEVPGAKVYPPQVSSDLHTGEDGMVGSKTWEFVIVPESSGPVEIPSLDFAFFDPGAGRIVHRATQPIGLQVEAPAPGASVSAPVAPAAAVPEAGLALRAGLDRPAHPLPALGGSRLALLVGLVLLLHGMLWVGPRLSLRGHWRRPRRAASGRGARRALSALQRAGSDGMTKETAAVLIERALHDAFGSLEEDAAEGDEARRAARDLLEEVQFLRYAPQLGDYSERIRELSGRAADVVRRWS